MDNMSPPKKLRCYEYHKWLTCHKQFICEDNDIKGYQNKKEMNVADPHWFLVNIVITDS